jgi:hypothetical protein
LAPVTRTLALALALALPVDGSAELPDPVGALRELTRAPLVVTGDVVGAAGLCAAAGIATAGDAVALVDANPVTRPALRGVASGLLHRAALAVSWTSTGALEALRGEDIERLPEAPATYLSAAPGTGRLATFLDGLRAAGLAVGDLLHAPLLVGARLVGARAGADRIAARRAEARTDALGPLPLPPAPAYEPPPERPAAPRPSEAHDPVMLDR